MSNWSIEFYTLENHQSPIVDWYIAQSKEVQAHLLRSFELLEEIGSAVTMPRFKSLGNHLHEIRVRVDRNSFRVIYFADNDQFVLLNGFQKMAPIPTLELATSQQYLEDFLAHKNNPMINLHEIREKILTQPEIKAHYDALQHEFQEGRLLILALGM